MELFLLFLHRCNFASVMNHDMIIWNAGYVIPVEGSFDLQGVATHSLRTTALKKVPKDDAPSVENAISLEEGTRQTN